MNCLHKETVYDTGRLFCERCGIQCEQPIKQSEEPFIFNDFAKHRTKEKYFQRALAYILGEADLSENERGTLERLAVKATVELGDAPAKLCLKKFVSRQERSDAALCRKHFPFFSSLNGHPLPRISSYQRRWMHLAYERASMSFGEQRYIGKKNMSCRNIIKDCLLEFQEQGQLPLSRH